VAVVTGTQGKSTTCHLTAALLEHAGLPVRLGGNIGRSLLGALPAIGADEAVVLELSSYQLEALPTDRDDLGRRVEVVCVTNVLADHLERHGSLEAYEAAKRRALEIAGPGAVLVLSADDERVRGWETGGREVRWFSTGASADLCVADGEFRSGDEVLGRVADLALPGAFQRANALAALGIAHALGAPADRLASAIAGLCGLAHRLQDLGAFGGHRVWDNGVSTTPDSTVSALEALEGAVVLLCGGRAKELPTDALVRAAARRTRTVVAFGESGPSLARSFAAGGVEAVAVSDLEAAVREAFGRLREGEALLFSPACASFDAFRNFEHRAQVFRAALPQADRAPA
jgi:UDP-N-acetylmuramoylalanine--D-glutamate ligase